MDLIVTSARNPYSISEAVYVPYSSLTIIPYFYTSFAKLELKRCHTLLSFFGSPPEKFALPDGFFEGEDQ
jgi:hypothetical protein